MSGCDALACVGARACLHCRPLRACRRSLLPPWPPWPPWRPPPPEPVWRQGESSVRALHYGAARLPRVALGCSQLINSALLWQAVRPQTSVDGAVRVDSDHTRVAIEDEIAMAEGHIRTMVALPRAGNFRVPKLYKFSDAELAAQPRPRSPTVTPLSPYRAPYRSRPGKGDPAVGRFCESVSIGSQNPGGKGKIIIPRLELEIVVVDLCVRAVWCILDKSAECS